MEKAKNEVTLGARLATRYAPKQILSSGLSWGPLIGVDEVRRLSYRFAERSITHDGDPALTKEWLVHFIMEIIAEKASVPPSDIDLEDVMNFDTPLVGEEQLHVYRTEVAQWLSSFAVQLSLHDPLWDVCEASNDELVRGECVASNSCCSALYFGAKVRKVRGGRSRSLKRGLDITASSSSLGSHRKEPVQHEMVRWSDLTTNLVRDYEHFHRFDEKELTFTQVRTALTSGRSSPTRSSRGKDGAEGAWAKVAQHTRDAELDALMGNEMHVHSADSIVVSPATGLIITSSKDGIVKLWDSTTGAFRHNLYNAGSAWVIGMFLLPDDDYILIATTNNQLTVLNFPEGNVMQKYLGCNSTVTALLGVSQLSALNVQRYGMRPGECGTYRVALHEGEQPEQYHHRRREAQNDVSSKNVPAKPVVGFLSPTTCWFESFSGIFFFGTADGQIGAFDIAADVRPNALLAGANTKPVRLLFLLQVHVGAVVGIFYTSYATSVFSAGTDGSIYRTALGPASEPVSEPRLVGHPSKPIRMMQWAPPSKYFITIHVDRRVVLWVIGRYTDPLHYFPPETQEVVSAALHPRRQRLVLLLSDKTLKVYETHGNKSLTTIPQPAPEPNFTATDVSRQMMERSAHDEDGVVAWHPYNSNLICCLRAAVIYEPARSHLAGEGDVELPLPAPERQRTASDSFDTLEDKQTQSLVSSAGHAALRRLHSHRSGIVAVAVQKHAWDLHTFDEESWCAWSLETGTLKLCVEVPRAARMEHLPLKRATVASCSWTTCAQTRLITGGQDGSLVIWDPATGAPLGAEALAHDTPEQLDSDVTVMSHRNVVIAWSARMCRIMFVNSGCILPNGIEESKSVVLRVPSLASVTACCVVRDAYLCVGTGDARIYFYSIQGGAPTHECVLRDKNEEERGAVVHLIFLNEQNQNILLIILDTGILFVYSYVTQTVLHRVRLVRRFECRIRRVLYVPEDGVVVYGDSVGRVRALDVCGCTSASADFRQTLITRLVFQGATDEITALDFFTAEGRRYLIVGSLDTSVRLFRIDESIGAQSALSLTSPQRGAPVGVVFVGVFGQDVWDLRDVATYSRNPPVAPRVLAAATAEEEALLESIVNTDTRVESVKSALESLTDEDVAAGRVRARKNTKAVTPSSNPTTPQPPVQRPFFLTDIHHVQDEVGPCYSLSCVSSTESVKPQQQQQQQMLQASPLPSSPIDTGNGSGGLQHVSLPSGHSSPSGAMGRRAQGRTKVCTLPHDTSPLSHTLEMVAGLTRSDRRSNSPLERSSPLQTSLTESIGTQRTKAMLAAMTRRLEAVQPKGHAKGEFTKKAIEVLLNDTDTLWRRNKSPHRRPGSEELRLALETRRKLAERMEEYKKQQAARRIEKRNSLPLVSARQHLTPVVIPQPSIIPSDARAGYNWMHATPTNGVARKPSAVSAYAGNPI
ncbi:hypothetical protein DQ04_08681000 [Trypanosoma grayi]|uniref:hypothetical protein n=1 Tax=Trypanosoma grayi TaxID=71804 RepID=UPI0004F496CA|nr:hypothetical protein DQ04_08681000 [Trypanosoma grayi]KEG07838.1 hypothetical protein DQ04_08681000 [Trypanosoma grayi]